MNEAAPFPWDEAMAFAFRVLRWSPQTFWRATPRELIAAAQGLAGRDVIAPAGAADLDRLMRAFPDGD